MVTAIVLGLDRGSIGVMEMKKVETVIIYGLEPKACILRRFQNSKSVFSNRVQSPRPPKNP